MSCCKEPKLTTRAGKGQKLTAEDHDKNLTEIKEAFAQVCSDINILSAALEAAGALSSDTADDFSGSLTGINQRLDDLETLTGTLDTQIGSISQTQIDDLQICVDKLKLDVTALQGDVATALVNSSDALTAANNALTASDPTALQAQIDDIVNNQIPDLQSQIDSLNTTLGTLQSTITTLGTTGGSGSGSGTPPPPCCTEFESIAPQIIADQQGAGTDEQLPFPATISLSGLLPLNAIAVQVLAVTECVADAGDDNECIVEVAPLSGTRYEIAKSIAIGGTSDQGYSVDRNTHMIDLRPSLTISGSVGAAIDYRAYVEKDATGSTKLPQPKAQLFVTGYLIRT